MIKSRFDPLRYLEKIHLRTIIISYHINPLWYPKRPMIIFCSDYFKGKKDLVGAEIGVDQGYNSLSILSLLPMKKLYCIDPWEPYEQYGKHVDVSNHEKTAQYLLKNYKDKTKFIKKYSTDAIKDIPEKLDLLYIDGNHSYEYVKKDIELFYPSVKNGGIIGGHDFKADCKGVIDAVYEFFTNKEVQASDWDWWVIKKN